MLSGIEPRKNFKHVYKEHTLHYIPGSIQILRTNLILALDHLNYELFNTICELYINASYQKDDQARKDFFDAMRQTHLGNFLQGEVEQMALHNPDIFAQVTRAFSRNLARRYFYRDDTILSSVRSSHHTCICSEQ